MEELEPAAVAALVVLEAPVVVLLSPLGVLFTRHRLPVAAAAPPLHASLTPLLSIGCVCIHHNSRSSVYGGISGKGKLKDPRPLKDPSYMRESIRVLITFLADHGYDHQVRYNQS